jgi:hypothetical protein
MSDTGETTAPVQDINKIPADSGPIGPAGESFFVAEAIKATNVANPNTFQAREADRQESSFNTFIADQKDAASILQAKTALSEAGSVTAPKVSDTMHQNADALRRMQSESPAQWQAVQAEIAAAQATHKPEAPAIVIKPSLRDRVLNFFGFGKKQEAVRQ